MTRYKAMSHGQKLNLHFFLCSMENWTKIYFFTKVLYELVTSQLIVIYDLLFSLST